jgi:DHA1 family bicyclomycin/chloramphenicol resistance-like MFS transporter
MAGVMSLTQMVFISVPVLAPSLGQAVLAVTHEWHGVFVVLLLAGILILAWSALRLPETLAPDNRRSIALRDVFGYFREMLTNRQSFGYAIAAGFLTGTMFAYLFSAQQVFTEVYRLGRYFPVVFAMIALGVAGFVNSRLVGRLGMRMISHAALLAYIVTSVAMLIAALTQTLVLPLYMALAMASMFGFGLMISNFTALAMEPQGHIAGTASSLFGSITTLIGIVVGTTIGQAYDGTMVPLAAGFLLSTCGAFVAVLITEKGRLFRQPPRRVM